MATTVSYLHPHIETRVVDNSTVVDQQSSTGTVTFMPYFSSRGVDGVIERYTSYAQFVADKGTPNFKKHGQPIYNVLQFLRGNGVVYGMRLLPDNATRANVVLGAKVVNGEVVKGADPVAKTELDKIDIKALNLPEGTDVTEAPAKIVFELVEDGDGEPKTKKIKVQSSEATEDFALGTSYTSENLNDAITDKLSSEDIKLVTGLLTKGTVGDTVSVNHVTKKAPATGKEGELLQIVCKGRGLYGNKYEVDLVLNKTMTESYNFAVYNLTVKESGKVVEGPYYVALQPEAVNLAGASMYIKNVIEAYSKSIAVVVNEALYDALAEELGADYATEDFLKLPVGGITLELDKGSDGDDLNKVIEQSDTDRTKPKYLKDQLLINAFSNTDMLSKTRYQIDILIDANYSFAVKQAMHSLATNRGDVFVVLDLGPDNVSAARKALEQINDFSVIADDRCTAFYAQTFTVFDSFTNSDILVTMPYFLAYKIPANDYQNGIHHPIAGPNRGVISGFKTMSFNPTMDEKEDLYKARVNYAEQDYRNTKLMSQLTSQIATSALSNINNMRVLLRMIRNVEQISENYFFEFASSSTLSHFEQAVNTYLSSWVSNGACQVCQGTVYQNDYDVVQRVVRVSIEVVFTGLIERIVIEFNVGSNAA